MFWIETETINTCTLYKPVLENWAPFSQSLALFHDEIYNLCNLFETDAVQ